MDLFKRVIRREIYLFMFMLGFAILKTASPQRQTQAEEIDRNSPV